MPVDGFGELNDTLDELKNTRQLEGENEVPLGKVCNKEFMRKYTDFNSIDAFFEQSSWTVESEEDFEAIPEDEFDEYVNEHTRFSNWEEMYSKAGTEWAAGQLGF